jgi:nucleoside-diphosphate-sugar epimerase
MSGTEFSSKPHGLINWIHYDDAADLIIACLKKRADIAGQVFLASDGVPVSRQEIADTLTNLRGKVQILKTWMSLCCPIFGPLMMFVLF